MSVTTIQKILKYTMQILKPFEHAGLAKYPEGVHIIITKTPDGHVWVASVPKDNLPAFGLYQYDGEGWTTHTLKTQLASETVTAVEPDANGLLWVGNWGRGIDVLDTTATSTVTPTRQKRTVSGIPSI